MSVAVKRRERFATQHPFCIYCGGGVEATHPDHNPARKLFAPGGFPKGFLFPACEACNAGKKDDESRVSLMAGTFNVLNPEQGEHTDKALLRTRAFLERSPDFARQIAAGIEEYDKSGGEITEPFGPYFSVSRLPRFTLPVEFAESFERVGVRIFQALYYRHTGMATKPSQHIGLTVITNAEEARAYNVLIGWTSILGFETPPTASKCVEPRFSFGIRMLDETYLLWAEIRGCGIWLGTILDAPPDAHEWISAFRWYSGTGSALAGTNSGSQ